MPAPVAYRSLEAEDEIRILVVHAGDESEAIECCLEHVKLNDRPIFEAISYTWGDGYSEQPIIVDGQSVTIQLNLYLALKVFRHQDQTRRLWVDALCINQSDLEERSMQVNMMRDIYHASSTTLIWLGEEVEDDSDAVEVFQEADVVLAKDLPTDPANLIFNNDRIEGTRNQLMPFDAFFSRTWFRRVWVLQEYAVSRKVLFHVGRKAFSGHAYDRLTSALYGAPQVAVAGSKLHRYLILVNHARWIRDNFHDGSTSQLGKVLHTVYGLFEATDVRDKIFALLGVIHGSITREFPADYSKAAPEVFHNAVRYIMQEEGYFYPLLSCVSGTPPGPLKKDMPSWTPDLSYVPDFHRSLSTFNTFDACGGTDRVSEFAGENGEFLILRGSIISIIGPVIAHDDEAKASWSGWCNFYQRCHDLLCSRTDRYPSGEDKDHVWWRLLVCDLCKSGNEWSRASIGFVEDDYLNADIASPIWQEHPGFSADKEIQSRQLRYYNTMNVTSAGMSFCCMEDGYAGWVPLLAEAGDRLCVFAGAGTPFVIRPSQDAQGDYQLVGDTYVHGVMYGEALARQKSEWAPVRLC